MYNKFIKTLVLTVCFAGVSACSSVEPPNTLTTQARDSVQRAKSVGAEQQAPLALREANQFLAKAEEAMVNEEYKEARYLLEKSMINSELAIARTNAKKSKEAASQIEQNLDALREEGSVSDQDTYSYE